MCKIQEESVLFGKFTNLEKENLANIRSEVGLISRIKATLDDLNIMSVLFDDQRKMVKIMDNIVKSISTYDNENRRAETQDSACSSREEQSKMYAKKRLSSFSDARTDTDVTVYARQRANGIWGTRNDPDNFSLPLALVNASIDEINTMIKRAERTSESVSDNFFLLSGIYLWSC
jgi:hypothetical protein